MAAISASLVCGPSSSFLKQPPGKASFCTSITVSASSVGQTSPHALPLQICQNLSISRRQASIGFLGFGLILPDCFVESNDAVAAEAQCEKFATAPSGLAFCDLVVGTGIPATKGMLIKAHYTGKLENGDIFDSSYKRGKPFAFRIGVGQVIRGWDDGILGTDGIPGMLAGGKRTLIIPPQLAYGQRGAGCNGGSCLIPPNSTLYFDVEFIGKA